MSFLNPVTGTIVNGNEKPNKGEKRSRKGNNNEEKIS